MQNTLPKSRLSGEIGVSTLQPQCSTVENSYSCSWSSQRDGAEDFNALVLTSTWSFDELKSRPNLHDVVPATVAGQEAVKFSANKDTFETLCELGWGTSFGTVWVGIKSTIDSDNCTAAARLAELVHEYAPR